MTVEKYPQAPILESAMSCIHDVSVENSCPECIDMVVEDHKRKDAKEVTIDDVAALLRMIIETHTTMMEILVNVVAKQENLEHAIKERLFEKDDSIQHKDGDASGQTAEASSSDSVEQSERKAEEETVKMLGFDPPLADDKPIGKYGPFPDADNLNGLE